MDQEEEAEVLGEKGPPVEEFGKNSRLRATEERVEGGRDFDHSPACPCPDCELSRLENGMEEVRGENEALLRRAVQLEEENRSLKRENWNFREETARWRAAFQALPKGQKECNVFTIFPRCNNCREKTKYFVAFRGEVVGTLFAGTESGKVEELVQQQGELKALRQGGLDIPDNLPEDVGGEKE